MIFATNGKNWNFSPDESRDTSTKYLKKLFAHFFVGCIMYVLAYKCNARTIALFEKSHMGITAVDYGIVWIVLLGVQFRSP